MPLITSKTNLKSLKYGNDRPGNGSSGQPYIQFDLPENATPEELEYYKNNRDSLDFPGVGAGFDLSQGGAYISQAAKYDQQRIQKFFKDKSRGPLFIAKQVALQLSNPKIQTGDSISFGSDGSTVGLLENTRIYNGGANTLAQVGVQGSGFHFDRHGTVPINPFQAKYEYVASEPSEPDPNRPRRLVTLYQSKLVNVTTEEDKKAMFRLAISKNTNLLIQYPGGPTSIGGIGLTTIHRYSNTDLGQGGKGTVSAGNKAAYALNYAKIQVKAGVNHNDAGLKSRSIITGSGDYLLNIYNTTGFNKGSVDIVEYGTGSLPPLFTPANTLSSEKTALITGIGQTIGTVSAGNFAYALNYDQLKETSGDAPNLNHDIKVDFRLKITGISGSATQNYETTANIASKYGIGNPGQSKTVKGSKKYDIDYNIDTGLQDNVNYKDIIPRYNYKTDAKSVPKDLIKFQFETIEVDSPDQPNEGAAGASLLVFRAFLTGIQDQHTANYSPVKYVGRGENFYAYDGFTRTLSFNFKVAPQTRQEMQPLYRKLNYLVSQLYPDYQTFVMQNKKSQLGNGFMRAPLTRLTIGDYIVRQPGFFTSMNITIPDDSPWEIAWDSKDKDSDMYELPHVLEVSCQFTPIHDFLPRRSWVPSLNKTANTGNINITPLITPNKNSTGFGNNFFIGKNSQFGPEEAAAIGKALSKFKLF